MRALVLALLATAAAAQTPGPPSETVDLVDRYLEAVGVEGRGPMADDLRAVFYADLDPALLAALVAFVESPLYERTQDSDGDEAGVDPALAERYLALYQVASVIGHAVIYPTPSRARRILAGLSEADARALVAFYESDAARYQGRVIEAGRQRWQSPRSARRAVQDSDVDESTRPAGPSPAPPPDPEPEEPEIFEVAEVQPELVGGLAALQAVVEYPEPARRAGIEGVVVVQFVVDERGRVVDPVVVRSPDESLSRAALEAVGRVRFRPGVQRGRPVPIRFAIPVTFRLE